MADHRYLQGVSLPKLHGLLVATMGVGPDESDRWSRNNEAVVAAHQAYRDQGGRGRLWVAIERAHGAAVSTSFISLEPGEFRLHRPTGADDVVVAAPVLKPGPSWRTLIAAAADEAEADGFFSSETLDGLIARARALVQTSQPGLPAFAVMAHQIDTALVGAGGKAFDPAALQALYRQAVPGFRLPSTRFAGAELLLRAQLALGFRFEHGFSGIAAGALADFLKTQDPAFVGRCVDFLAETGRLALGGGKASVREALAEPTVYALQGHLQHAAYCYAVALYAGTVVQQLGRAAQLSYKPLVAEESWVCTMTGLFYGAERALGGYESIVEDIRLALEEDRVDGAYKVAHGYASEIFPILPEPVLDIFVARAMVEEHGERLQEGVRKLEALCDAQAWQSDGVYESSLVENGLLDGYKAMGDHANVERMARRIAARMVVARVLKPGAQGTPEG